MIVLMRLRAGAMTQSEGRRGWTMKRRYASFLIRWWQHGTGRQRVTVAHIQSGEQVSPESLPAAFAWIADRTAAADAGGDSDGDGDGDPEAAPAAAADEAAPNGEGAPPADSSS